MMHGQQNANYNIQLYRFNVLRRSECVNGTKYGLMPSFYSKRRSWKNWYTIFFQIYGVCLAATRK